MSKDEKVAMAEGGKGAKEGAKGGKSKLPYVQNRELSWLMFNKRCLDQGADKTVPPLERLKFVSIFWSNLQEFFMVRVGSLTDLSLLKNPVIDTKSMMTPAEQIEAIHARCHELYPLYEKTFANAEEKLAESGIKRLDAKDLTDEQREFVRLYAQADIIPYLAPQVVNVHHPFPHLENGALYVVTQLAADVKSGMPLLGYAAPDSKSSKGKDGKKDSTKGALGVTLGIIPVPARCDRVIKLPGEGFQYMLVEHVLEMFASEVFSMYITKKTNIICVTRNADLDATEGIDEEVDFREHMKKILKKRGRLAPVRLDSQYPFSTPVGAFLLDRLELNASQHYSSAVPLNMGYAFALPGMAGDELAAPLSYEPFTPAWSTALDRTKPLFPQIEQRDVLCIYPYESMDTFIELVHEAVFDPEVVSIKITLYRLATKSRLAELLISAAEAGKDVTLLFELRARFDEGNNIEWSQRCEDAGCKVLYGFRDYKVHSKLCLITRKTAQGMKYITQVGTGNYNEKTATLYTDYSFMTSDERIGRDAVEFFQNVGLEAIADTYQHLRVAPIQIKRLVLERLDEQMEKARAGEPCGVFIKTNSVTDLEVIKALSKASQVGVPITLFVRGISCIVPGVKGYTDNIRVVSVVGRLLEHSRVYAFGPFETDSCELFISSADLMTRNMDRRVEVACPIYDATLRGQIIDQVKLYLSDTVKLRELLPTGEYTDLGHFVYRGEDGKKIHLDAQEELISFFARGGREAGASIGALEAAQTDLGAQVAALANDVHSSHDKKFKAAGLGGSSQKKAEKAEKADKADKAGKAKKAEKANKAEKNEKPAKEHEDAKAEETARDAGVGAGAGAGADAGACVDDRAAADSLQIKPKPTVAPAAKPEVAPAAKPEVAPAKAAPSAPENKKGFVAWLKSLF